MRGVSKKQVKNPFQKARPSRSILFAVIAQASVHTTPAIAIAIHAAATAKCS